MKLNHLVVVVSLGVISGPALAGPIKKPHGDVLIGIENGQLVTNLIAEDKSLIIPGVRVFGSELGETGIPFFTDEPGWQIQDGTFVPQAALGFQIMTALGQWNGDGFDSLDPLLAETMTLSFAGGAFSATTGSGLVDGFDLLTDDKGGLHEHVDFALNGAGAADPSLGIYLLELQFNTSMSGIVQSESTWIVFNNGLSEREHDAAIEWVEMHLVPLPATLALFALVETVARRRRHR